MDDLLECWKAKYHPLGLPDNFSIERWLDDVRRVALHNSKVREYSIGLNAFSGFNVPSNWGVLPTSIAETHSFLTSLPRVGAPPAQPAWPPGAGSEWVDFRRISMTGTITGPLLTPVKDQKSCSSCYVFASLCMLECYIALQNHSAGQSLSISPFLNCTNGTANFGQCNMGNMHYMLVAMANLSQAEPVTVAELSNTPGATTEQDYVFNLPANNTACQQIVAQCRATPTNPVCTAGCNRYLACTAPTNCAGYCGTMIDAPTAFATPVSLPFRVAIAVVPLIQGAPNQGQGTATYVQRSAVYKTTLQTYGPLAVNMYFPQRLGAYSSGIVSPYGTEIGLPVNHSVVLVGYQNPTMFASGFWVVRNSAGPAWGEQGYFRVNMNFTGSIYGPFMLFQNCPVVLEAA